MRRFIESLDEPTTINRPGDGGAINLGEPEFPRRSKDDDLRAATPLVWICVVALVLVVVVLMVRKFV